MQAEHPVVPVLHRHSNCTPACMCMLSDDPRCSVAHPVQAARAPRVEVELGPASWMTLCVARCNDQAPAHTVAPQPNTLRTQPVPEETTAYLRHLLAMRQLLQGPGACWQLPLSAPACAVLSCPCCPALQSTRTSFLPRLSWPTACTSSLGHLLARWATCPRPMSGCLSP